MENMAETIVVNIVANVFSSLWSCAIERIGIPSDVEGELRKMQTTMSTIKDVLLDPEERQMSNRAVKGWLEMLELIRRDAEGLLKTVATETERRQVGTHTSNRLKRKVCDFFTRYDVGRKIRDIGKGLDKIVWQMTPSESAVKVVEGLSQINRMEETYSFVNSKSVIGRDADKEELVRLLLSPGDEVAIIPIVGIGGLGKTKLAQLVYNDDTIQDNFPKRLWVWISKDFDIRKILIQLLQAGDPNWNTSYGNEGLELLQNRVRSLLREHKFLLFLDNVWNEDCVKWKKLEELLTTQGGGSRIVVTTRSEMVASIVRTSTMEPYVLGRLSEYKCLRILVKLAFKGGDQSKHPYLVKIGREIVKNCGGVPLEAEKLGASLFSTRNEQDWVSMRDNGCS